MKNIILLLNAGDTRIAVLENISSLAIVQKIIFKYTVQCTVHSPIGHFIILFHKLFLMPVHQGLLTCL